MKIYVGPTSNGPWGLFQENKDTTYTYEYYAKNKKWSVATVHVNNFTNNTINKIEYLKE